MSTQIDRLTELAKEDPKRQFYSIAHMITFGALYAAFRGLRKKASAGVDGVTYQEYERDVAGNIQTLHERLRNGKYQAQPLRRVYIPKENGKQRPISIPALEDKIVQKAMVEILNAIYEQDFLDCSYGFRPGRGRHQALDEMGRVICTRPTRWILEIDVTAYFDSIVREQLMEMKRVRDGSVLCLIRKWIQVGVIEEGRLLLSETGTGQGQTISPLLANIYLHHVLDEWFENEVKPRLRGAAHEIRFADDAVLCFQYKEDADKVMEVLPKRFAKYGLTIHPEKTRLLEFGRYAEENEKRQGKKAAHVRFPRLHIRLCPQPEREIHRARENDEEAVSTGPKGDCRMVPGEPPPACGEAAENPKRQTPGPLPVLRAINELPESPAVQSRGPAHLA